MNLTIKVTDLHPSSRLIGAGPLLICDRCHNDAEVVVATMEILPLDRKWSLCGMCRRELPTGHEIV
jgi:hypothetical protein